MVGTGPSQRRYQQSLAWLKAAMQSGVSVPLAPRLQFPAVEADGCAFLFTDAAREAGTGHGAFSVIEGAGGHRQPEFLYVDERWEPEVLRALQCNEISMVAGEMYGAVAAADTLLAELQDATHLVIFTDSEASELAINTGNSPSPQLNYLIGWLQQRWPRVQLLAVWQKGVRNDVADRISRHSSEEVQQEAAAAGLVVRRLQLQSGALEALHTAWHEAQAHGDDMIE